MAQSRLLTDGERDPGDHPPTLLTIAGAKACAATVRRTLLTDPLVEAEFADALDRLATALAASNDA